MKQGKGKRSGKYQVDDSDTALATGMAKFKGLCHTCGKPGHKSCDCWHKDANASKRPSGWNPNMQQIGRGGNSGPNRQGGQGRRKLKCWHCQGDHVKRDCPKLKNKSESAGNVQGSSSDSSSSADFVCNVLSGSAQESMVVDEDEDTIIFDFDFDLDSSDDCDSIAGFSVDSIDLIQLRS